MNDEPNLFNDNDCVIMIEDEVRKYDPRQTAAYLLQQHGHRRAYDVVLKGVFQAQEDGDNYRLSVWREVKLLLSKAVVPEEGTS